jgi:UDP-glucuronate decarboxylase
MVTLKIKLNIMKENSFNLNKKYIQKMNRILITGGAGNIGSSLALRLNKNDNNEVTVVDNLLTGDKTKLETKNEKIIKFINADVNSFRDISAVMLSNKFDYVFHYAAVVGVKRTLDNPKMVLNDIEGIKNILDLSKNTGVKRMFFSSSSEVYGEPVEIPQFEDTTPLNSKLPYAIVKNVGEAFFKSYYQEYGLDYTIFRFFNTYGPRQSTDFVIAKFIDLAMKNQDITIYGEGSQTRTFCFIDDNLDTIEKILYVGHCKNEVINIGSDDEYSILELANFIIKLLDSSSKIIHLPPLPEGDMTRRKPDLAKMKQILNRELTPLSEGIMKTLNQRMF